MNAVHDDERARAAGKIVFVVVICCCSFSVAWARHNEGARHETYFCVRVGLGLCDGMNECGISYVTEQRSIRHRARQKERESECAQKNARARHTASILYLRLSLRTRKWMWARYKNARNQLMHVYYTYISIQMFDAKPNSSHNCCDSVVVCAPLW